MVSTDPLPIRLLSHNIRYATKSPFKGEEKWNIRKPYVVASLRFNTTHCPESFICLQEVLHEQLLDILSSLNGDGDEKTWAYIGVGREDGKESGEYSPILYQPTVWSVKSSQTVWLSETPDVPSKGWDASCTRILTIGTFQHRHSIKHVVAMNTHLDDQGSKSRLESAKIILDRVSSYMKGSSTAKPIFLAGDFNSEPNQEAYEAITNEGFHMYDLEKLVPKQRRYGELNTFTGFGHEKYAPKRIDFLFLNQSSIPSQDDSSVNNNRRWAADGYGVLANVFEDGVYCSDHRAVIGDVLLY